MTEPIDSPRRRIAWLEVLCWGLAAAFLLYFLYCFLFVAVATFRYPHARDYGEGVLLAQVKLLAEGRSLYADPAATRRLCTYPPVYHLLAAPWMDPAHPSLLGGRILSVLATLGTALFVGLTVWAMSRSRAAAALGAGLALSFPYVHEWGALYRVDMASIFFTVAGIWWTVRFRQSRWALVAAAWFLLAGFTRHSLIAAPAAATVSLLATKPRRGIAFALILVGSTGAVFLAIDLATRHEFFANIIGGNRLAANLTGGFKAWTKQFFRWYAATSILAAVYVPLGLRARRWNVVTLWVIAALLMTLPEKRGAWTNYYIEFLVASAIASAAAAALIVSKAKRPALVSCAIALALTAQFSAIAWKKDIYPSPIDPAKSEREDRVIAAIRALAGPVVAQDVSFVILAGKEMRYQPLVMTQLSREGLWDQSTFVEEIRKGRLAGILMDEPLERHPPGYLFTVEQLAAMRERYVLKESWPSNPEGTRGKFLYVPKGTR